LPGNSELSAVGDPPDWFTPRYGDEEYLWSLNRMMHWKTLLQAYALTGDRRYPQKVVAELDDWIARAQPPAFRHPDGTPNPEIVTNSGPPAWRSLEMGMRMFDSWPTVLEHLAGTEFLPAERLTRVAETLALHAGGLSLLTPLLWPEADHNHYFMEMLGLLAVGAHARELPGAARWIEQAMHELQRCVSRQFTEDGGHVEGCPSYHNICVVLLARYVSLSEMCERKVPESVQRVTGLSADHVVHSVRPTGRIVPWGDSTRNNQVEAAVWAGKGTGDVSTLRDLVGVMGIDRVREDCAPHLWDVDDPEALFAAIIKPGSARALVRFDRGNDQVMMRTSWQKDALSVFFACHAPLTPGSGHQHIDLGGFDFTAFGRTLVADPGVFTYREGEDRKQFKSAEYHSVLTIDGRGPFDYVNRWRYTPQKEGRVTSVTVKPDHARIDSFHRNYEPALCRRTLALVDGRLLVVIDSVTGLAPESTIQIHFHVDSLRVTWDPAETRAVADDADVKLALYSSGGMECELMPGRISEVFDAERRSTRVRLFDRGGAANRVHATVLVPVRAAEKLAPVRELKISAATHTCEFMQAGRKYRVGFE
jgi:hypothetical protein